MTTIRLQPSLDAYKPLRATEPWTVDVPVTRGELCACGGWLFQHLGETVAEVVTRHNLTEIHKEWSNDRTR